MLLSRAAYRTRQFFSSLRPRVLAEEQAEIAQALTPAEQRLFESIARRDQRHGLDVYRTLCRQGQDDAALLAAALLHDVGKGRISVWHRVAYVLLAAAAPGLVRRIAGEKGPEWRQALWRCLRHAERGAALAEEAGSSADVVRLIRLQEQDAERANDPRLRLLQAADDAC